MKKRILFLIMGAALLGVGYLAYGMFSRGQAARAAQTNQQTAAVQRGTLVAQIGASGTVRSNQSAQLTWQTSGLVGEVKVVEGDRVSAGMELASLAHTSLPQNVILAQADLVNAQKALDDLLQSQTASAQARQALKDAQQALEDVGKNTALQQAQAWDAYLKARQTYSDTMQAHTNLINLPNSPKAQAAREQLENAQALVRRLRAYYNSLPGNPDTNPEKAKALFNLKMARLRAAQAQALVDQYGGEASADELERADADLALVEANLTGARVAWERVKDGPDLENKTLLEAQLADAQRGYDRVKGGPNPDDIAAAQARIEAAHAALDAARLVAPFSGMLTIINNKPGDKVSPGTLAFRLDDLSRLLVDVQVSEVDINQIQAGQLVLLTFDSILGKEYHGKVVKVAQVGEEQQGVVNFAVMVELTDADDQVKPGMTVSVTITVSEVSDVLLVPNRAVRSVDGERVVYVLRNGASVAVPVILGRSSDIDSEVLEGGLKEGDLIVLNPQAEIQFGPGSQGNNPGGGPFGGGAP